MHFDMARKKIVPEETESTDKKNENNISKTPTSAEELKKKKQSVGKEETPIH